MQGQVSRGNPKPWQLEAKLCPHFLSSPQSTAGHTKQNFGNKASQAPKKLANDTLLPWGHVTQAQGDKV